MIVSHNPKEDRSIKVLAVVMASLVAFLTTLRACQAINEPGANWHGPFGTIDYTKDPGAMRYVLGLMERDL